MDAGDKPKLSWSREYWLHHPTQQRVPNEDPRVPKTIDAAKKAHDWFLIGSQADIADGFYRRDLDMSTSADAKPLYFATWHPSGGRVVDLVALPLRYARACGVRDSEALEEPRSMRARPRSSIRLSSAGSWPGAGS